MDYQKLLLIVLLLSLPLVAYSEINTWELFGQTYCAPYINQLRKAEILFGVINDEFTGDSDDQGLTHGFSLFAGALFEKRGDPDVQPLELSFYASSALSTRFEGTETADFQRKQFPEELNTLIFRAMFGRELYWRIGLGVQDRNYDETGRWKLATYQQFRFHEWHSGSARVKNLDIGDDNVISMIGELGVGGELSVLDPRLLFRGDIGLAFDTAEMENTALSTRVSCFLGLSDIQKGIISPAVLFTEFNLEGNKEGVNLNSVIGFELNIHLCEEFYFKVRPKIIIPVLSGIDNFYDADPEAVALIEVGGFWDRDWKINQNTFW